MGDKGDRLFVIDFWYDVGVYVEMFVYIGRYWEVICEFKSFVRWFVGCGIEKFWDEW